MKRFLIILGSWIAGILAGVVIVAMITENRLLPGNGMIWLISPVAAAICGITAYLKTGDTNQPDPKAARTWITAAAIGIGSVFVVPAILAMYIITHIG
jgi:hypothetical protein